MPGLEKVRHEVVVEMMQYYRTFLDQHQDDPALRREIAETCLRLGRLTVTEGGRSDALLLLRRADHDLEILARASPTDRALSDQRILCFFAIALLEEMIGEMSSARSYYERRIQACEKAVRENPGDSRLIRRLAAFNGSLANLLIQSLGDKALARQTYLKCLEIQQDLVKREPAQTKFKSDLAMTYHNLTPLTEDVEEQSTLLDRALALRKEAFEQEPSNNFYRRNVGRTLLLIGLNQTGRGRWNKAFDSFEESRAALEQVVVAQPGSTEYQGDLAQTYHHLGAAQAKLGRLAEAQKTWQQARAIYQKLLHTNPEDKFLREGLRPLEATIAAGAGGKGPSAKPEH